VQLYTLVPLVAAMALASLGATALLMGPELRTNRSAAAWFGCAAWWAGCEVLWSCAPDARTALLLHRIAAPGFVFLAPLALQYVYEMTEVPSRPLRRLRPVAFSLGGLFLVLCWSGRWMLADMARTSFGWGLVPGPLFAVWALLTAAGFAWAIGSFVRDYLASAREVTRSRGPLIARLVPPLAAIGVTTDIFLPLAGVQLPRLGSLAMAGAGAILLWALARYGFSRLHPSAFSTRILHTLPDGIALTSLHGRIRVANEKLGELLGCSAADAVGRQIADHLDGSLIDPPREQRDVECMLQPLHGPPLPVCVSTAPIAGPEAGPRGVVLAIQDLREVAALRNRLLLSGRLAAVGELAAGIAHEINNPLAFVRSNLALLRRELAKKVEGPTRVEADSTGTEDWAELLDECVEGIDRAAMIVRDVRELSHTGGSGPEPTELNELLEQVLRVARTQLHPDVRVETRYAELEPVCCDPQRLKQVFLNLLVNAGQAIEGTGRIRVSTSSEGDRVHVVVEDDGCGIPPELRERIFDPFFTTKPVGRGTGLGLSIAYEIVRSHGGEIWCESERGRGTAFHVRLPQRRAE
jgi:PAS domain S-box-containing protein